MVSHMNVSLSPGHRTSGVLTYFSASEQAQNICITFVQRWPNVFDVGPTLYKCYANVLCLLGYVGPTSSTLAQHCTNAIQMFCVCCDTTRVRRYSWLQVP